ncbi:MAG: RHS repeat-associated core domain-containing protein [Blastocatellales bacterium]|nr:RHS repeat-associated core domain-containing protein [Blastocatellales bacterium]
MSICSFLGSKERDAETGLDYFIARYYSATQGRFTSVDPENAGAEADAPQTWNGYSYALNNPVVFSDPDGLKVRVCDANGACDEIDDKTASNYLFNRKYLNSIGLKIDGKGKIFDANGNQVGSYRRTSFDDLPDSSNRILFGTARYAPALEKFTTVGGAVAAAIPAAIIMADAIAGPAAIDLGIKYGTEAWRVFNASRPLGKMGHAAKHLQDFQKYANLSKEEVAKILEYVRQTGTQVGSSNGGRTLEKVVEIGTSKVLVRVVESASGVIKTGYPVH